MTREEAKAYIIQHCMPNYPKMDKTEWDAAMGKAIEALSWEPSEDARCSETPNSSDCISRKAAIDTLDTIASFLDPYGEEMISKYGVKIRLEFLGPVKPEHKTGRWIQKHNIFGVAYCSECDYELHTNDTNFCPNCGADMRGKQDD